MDDFGDIEIPIVYIDGDWSVDDLETLDDCEDAFIKLMSIVASLEQRLEDLTQAGSQDGTIGRCRAALRWKKLALQLVNQKKARFGRVKKEKREDTRDRLVLTYIESEDPGLVAEARIWASAAMKRQAVETT